MKNPHPAITLVLLLILWFLPFQGSTKTTSNTNTEPCAACESLANLRINDVNLLSTAVVPAEDGLPEYCRVLGYVRPAINFEIRLPTEDWNGKFYMAGCGAFCGIIYIRETNLGLSRNYAFSAMDGGHWGENVVDGRWAYHNRPAEIDWAYRAVHETARVTKIVIESYYGQAPQRSYFAGCSNGGRMANMEAWRYPEDFDGIISGAPWLAPTEGAILGAWLTQVNTGPDGKAILTSADAKLIAKAVYEACDAQDGLEDGLIDDPRLCSFNPAGLLCESSQVEGCLTAQQVETLKYWYDSPRNSTGEALYLEGLPLGSEPFWPGWIMGPEDGREGFFKRVSENFLRYLAFQEDPGDSYTITDFDFDKDPPRLEYMASIFNSDNPGLEAFQARGGKLLMWHGWADALVPPLKTVEYYEAVEAIIGSRKTTQDFFRLFMIPGMDHCGILDGPGIRGNGIDPLAALEKWVEQGEAPAFLMTTKKDEEGNVLWTRPVCPYPQRAVYKGEGDPKDAGSFECVDP